MSDGRRGRARSGRRLHGDAGQVGGIEAIPFGLLVFVLGGLLLANAWAVVDAKFATDAAARQAARTYVEATGATDPAALAADAARATVAAHGRDPARTSVTVHHRGLVRCARVTVEVTYEVPALTLPLVGGYGRGPFTVRSTHREVVDPYRDGVDGTAEAC